MTQAGDERRYVRAVEAAWSKIIGKPALVSPREFEAIDAWRRRGVPLAVVLEVITAAGRRRSGKPPRSITSIAAAVESAWAVIAAGRTAQTPHAAPDARQGRDEGAEAWARALARQAPGTPLHALLERLLGEAKGGRDAAALDAALDRFLPGAAPEDLVERTAQDVRRELASFRGRMSDEEFQSMLQRAHVDRLRAALDVPRIALTR